MRPSMLRELGRSRELAADKGVPQTLAMVAAWSRSGEALRQEQTEEDRRGLLHRRTLDRRGPILDPGVQAGVQLVLAVRPSKGLDHVHRDRAPEKRFPDHSLVVGLRRLVDGPTTGAADIAATRGENEKHTQESATHSSTLSIAAWGIPGGTDGGQCMAVANSASLSVCGLANGGSSAAASFHSVGVACGATINSSESAARAVRLE